MPTHEHHRDVNERMDEAGGVSAYEAKRLQRIQENRAKLLSLNLPTLQDAAPAVKKRPRVEQDPSLVLPPRRSSRLQQLRRSETADDDTTAVIETPASLIALPSPRRSRGSTHAPVGVPSMIDLPVVEPSVAIGGGKRQRVSCSQLDVDVSAFHDAWLGKHIWPKGKQTVVEGLCPQYQPVFSKMSGIQAWRNAIVLFLNVQGGSGYENAFTETTCLHDATQTAVYFRWFAQSRQHEETPVIQRLMKTTRGNAELMLPNATIDATDANEAEKNAELESTSHEPVFLFLRHVDGPYIYCGRLGFLGLVPQSRPLEMRWQLLDVDAFDWPTVKQLIDAGRPE